MITKILVDFEWSIIGLGDGVAGLKTMLRGGHDRLLTVLFVL